MMCTVISGSSNIFLEVMNQIHYYDNKRGSMSQLLILFYLNRTTKEASFDHRLEHLCHLKEIGCWGHLCLPQVHTFTLLSSFGFTYVDLDLNFFQNYPEERTGSCVLESDVLIVNRPTCLHQSYQVIACIWGFLLLHAMLLKPEACSPYTINQGIKSHYSTVVTYWDEVLPQSAY